MKNSINIIKASAVAAALLPLTSFAAIDDQGMQYVSAAEGLHGSMRVNIWNNVDDDTNDVTTGGSANSLRLWVNGTADLGGGMSSTYYWEVRQGSGGVSGEALGTEAWDLGLSGSFGSVNFGKLGMVAPRLVPGGSLDTVHGSNDSTFAADPGVNGLRYESPTMNGFKAGFSAVVDQKNSGSGTLDDSVIDQFSFAVKYDNPIGLQVGAGYESKTQNVQLESLTQFDDKSGWRFGTRYGQDNWLLAYEFRNYDGQDAYANKPNVVTAAAAEYVLGGAVSALAAKLGSGTSLDYDSNLKYQLHRLAVQVKVDRITASANYSTEEMKIAATAAVVPLDRTALAVDVAYALGSRSLIALGFKSVETEQYAAGAAAGDVNLLAKAAKDIESDEVAIYYRVDF